MSRVRLATDWRNTTHRPWFVSTEEVRSRGWSSGSGGRAAQNAALNRRLAELEKRQKALEPQKRAFINPTDAMAADLPNAGHSSSGKLRQIGNHSGSGGLVATGS